MKKSYIAGLALASIAALGSIYFILPSKVVEKVSLPEPLAMTSIAGDSREDAYSIAKPQETRRQNSTAIDFREGFDQSMVNDFSSPLYVSSVIAGKVTREMYGEGYDQKIAKIAKQHIFAESDPSEHVPGFCGLEDLKAYDELEEFLNSSSPSLADELGRIFAEADRLANLLPSYMDDGWSSGTSVQIKHANTNEETAVWWGEGHPASTEKGLFRRYSSVRIGDRDFYLNFNSADFADLNHEMVLLKKRRDEFWRDVRSLRPLGK